MPPSRPRLACLILAFASALPLFAADPPTPADSAELAQLYQEDQSDRRPGEGKSIDWSVVAPRDQARQARVKELYATGQLKTGADYHHAAMVLQHGSEPEDYLLAHEFCVIALSKGYSRALWLAAATEDRFLRSIGRPQRFGTQFRSEGGGPMQLQETDERVTDDHRREMKVPALAESRERAVRMNEGRRFSSRPITDGPPLAQDAFSETDDGDVAWQKLRKLSPRTREEYLRFQLACRDYCTRFPDAAHYGDVRVAAASHWHGVSSADLSSLGKWDATTGELDPKLRPEQRADVAVRLAYGRALNPERRKGASYEDAVFTEMLNAASSHPQARNARDSLLNVAMHVSPEVAIPPLRKLYPDDPGVAAALRAIERLGQPCDLTLATIDGGAVRTRDYRGKVVMIHFWARSFGSSVQALPRLKELVAKHGAENLAMISVCADETADIAREVVAEHGLAWPVHLDPWRGKDSIRDLLHAKTLPYYLLIDREGKLRFRGIQPVSAKVTAQIETLLAEKNTTAR